MKKDDFHRPVTKRKAFYTTVGPGTVCGALARLRELNADATEGDVAGNQTRTSRSSQMG